MSQNLNLKQMLSVLSRSSPYAVSTLREKNYTDEFIQLKEYLYVTTEIENDVNVAVRQIQLNQIIFVCGSAGDGKSEILTRCQHEFSDKVNFHLDATHSLGQHESAVDALNKVFTDFNSTQKALVVGINIGMMQRFINEGDDSHSDLKRVFKSFFDCRMEKAVKIEGCQFFNFEAYPRIIYKDGQAKSDFIASFLQKLTCQELSNPFYQKYLEEKQLQQDSTLHNNFALLSELCVQNRLIELFAKARLYEEQFLIPRNFLDFIYQILVTDNKIYLQDQVFAGFDNELAQKIAKLDPLLIRHEAFDKFIVDFCATPQPTELEKFFQIASAHADVQSGPMSILRLCYLMADDERYQFITERFKAVFNDKAFEDYLFLLECNRLQALTGEQEDKYEQIFVDVVIKAIFTFANKYAPSFGEKYLTTRVINDFSVGARISFEIDFDKVESIEPRGFDEVMLPILVKGFGGEKESIVVVLSLKLMRFMHKIVGGYRPNLQEKDEIIKFEEILGQFILLANRAEEVAFVGDDLAYKVLLDGRRFSGGEL